MTGFLETFNREMVSRESSWVRAVCLVVTAMVIATFLVLTSAAAQDDDPFRAHVRPTEPLTPEKEQRTFQLPPGFAIQLFAAEPEIHKPLNFAFDGKGRLWVSETVEYPYPAPPDRPARDRIRVLEDTDGDGRADKFTTFADGLNIPIGVLPYGEGAIVFAIPNIWYLRDVDHDGRCDVREKLLGPFDYSRDTHGLNNSFRRSFDGWIYACHGFNNHSKVTGRDGHVVELVSGNTYRFRPDGSRIEHFTHGQVNPYGMAIDEWGDLFTADCHSKPLTHLIPGGYYRSFGRPHDGLGFAPEMMAHLHGSTAIAGVAVVDSPLFPAALQGHLLSGNVMTSRVNHNRVESRGATLLAVEEPDFVITTDPWFRPVDLRFGPDGALYVADFYNRIIGHYEVPLDHPGRDRFRGRIWRITSLDGEARKPLQLEAASTQELIQTLDHSQVDVRLLALNLLADRLGDKAVEPARRAWSAATPRQRAALVWLESRGVEAPQEARLWKRGLTDEDPVVRAHSWKVLREQPLGSSLTSDVLSRGLTDRHPRVQLAAALAAERHPRLEWAPVVLRRLSQVDGADAELRYGLRMALRSHCRNPAVLAALLRQTRSREDKQLLADVLPAIPQPFAASALLDIADTSDFASTLPWDYLARNLAANEYPRLLAVAMSWRDPSTLQQAERWCSIAQAWRERGARQRPAILEQRQRELLSRMLATAAEASGDSSAPYLKWSAQLVTLLPTQEALETAHRWLKTYRHMEPETIPLWTAVLAAQQRFALGALVVLVDREDIPDRLRALIRDAIVSPASPDSSTELLRRCLRELPASAQLLLARSAVQQRTLAVVVADEILRGRVSRQLLADRAIQQSLLASVPTDTVRRLTALLPSDLAEAKSRMVAVQAASAKLRQLQGDPEGGRAVFEKKCGICHQLAGKGNMIGPQLDGIGARGLNRLVEDVLDPNRNVDPKFRSTLFQLVDGQVLTALVRDKQPGRWLLADAEGREFTVAAADVAATKALPTSLMPVDVTKDLSSQQLSDLFAYLLQQTAQPSGKSVDGVQGNE